MLVWIAVWAVVLTGILAVGLRVRRYEREIGVDEWGSGVPVSEDERRARQLGFALTAGTSTGPW